MVYSDIISFFEGLINDLGHYATEQDVELNFSSNISHLNVAFNQEETTQQVSMFLIKIVDFTPQKCVVNVSISEYNSDTQGLFLNIINTGINLSRLTEVLTLTRYITTGHGIGNESTKFILKIPIVLEQEEHLRGIKLNKTTNLWFTPYYLEIGKRLTTHFSNIENLEKLAEAKGSKEGFFLKRVNLFVRTYMHDNTFNVEKLSKYMALSRAQLYRKLKALTEMSPIQYLLFMRLQIAKDLLEDDTIDLNISEVSFRVGFVSNSHFSRAFKKQFGLNPSSLLQKSTKTTSR